MTSIISFIQRNYSYLVFSVVFLGVTVGIVVPKPAQALKPLMLPLVSIMVWAMCDNKVRRTRTRYKKGEADSLWAVSKLRLSTNPMLSVGFWFSFSRAYVVCRVHLDGHRSMCWHECGLDWSS